MKDFNKYFDFIADDETRLAVKKIADKANLVSKNCISLSTDFYNQMIIDYSIPIINSCDINYKLFPNYEHSERKSLILYPSFLDAIDEKDYITALRINNKSKFKELDHNNYLGSIMSLGIERSKIGDIYVHDNFADIICHSDLSDVILYGLEKVGSNKVEIEEISVADVAFKEPDHVLLTISATSMRLDNIVKAIINKSRDISADLIKSGDVKVNFVVEDKASSLLKKGDLLSIRRYGRFLIYNETGSTKSGKIKLEIKHYTKVSKNWDLKRRY